MGNWTNLSIKGPIEPLKQVASGIATVTSTIATLIGIQKSILQIISALAIDLLNPQALAIKAALAILEELLEKYIKVDARLHMLVVPLRKRLPDNMADPLMMPYAEDSWVIDETISEETKTELQQALERVGHYDQGNEGFGRTVIEATYDPDDPNAPKYGETEAIHAMVILCGAQSIMGVYDLLRAIQGLLGTALKGNPLIPNTITKTPQDLRVTPIAAPNSVRVGMQLTWGNPPTLQVLAEFDGVRIRLEEVAIIRSTNDEIMNAKDWTAIFGGSQPAELTREQTEVSNTLTSADKKTVLIKQFRFNGVINAYIDDDASLVKDTTYYYTVAFRYSLAEDPQGKKEPEYTLQKYTQISNVVSARIETNLPSTRGGVKPDWISHPSVLDLIPDLKFFMALLQARIASLGDFTLGANAALQSYIKFLEAELTRYQDFADEINAKVAKLSTLLALPAAGIYVTVIDEASGGVDTFLRTLTTRLTDTEDTTAPPFFRTGFTAGIVLLLGAPNPAEFASTKALLELIFGAGSGNTPFEDALDSIDNLLSSLENTVFGDDMKPGTPSEGTSSKQTFDDQMNPVDASDSTANVPFDP